MYEIQVRTDFDAAHRLYDYEGKCARLHGHTWVVEATVSSESLDFRGMVCDFHDLRRGMAAATAPFDHALINEVTPFDRLSPTSENLAKFIFEHLQQELSGLLPQGALLSKVTVWETKNSSASYWREK